MDRRGDPCRSNGLSHLQDLRPRDSGCGLAPTTFGSRALESLMDRRRAPDPGHRFSNGGWAPEVRCHASAPALTAGSTLKVRSDAYRSHERWIQGRFGGTPVREEGATRPPAHSCRRHSAFDTRSVAIDVRGCGAIHRLRDMASEWPIQVRVTTANAGCVSTRNLNQNRRRLRVKAVPARTPTGSLPSLPPRDCMR